MAPEFGVGSMAFTPLLILGLYRPVSVATASFALHRSHRGEMRLTVGGIESSLDSQRKTYSPNSVALVRKRSIPTERPPPVGEVSANFCG